MWFSIRKILRNKTSVLNIIHLEKKRKDKNNIIFMLGILSLETSSKLDNLKKYLELKDYKLLNDNQSKQILIKNFYNDNNLFETLNRLDGLIICYDNDTISNQHLINTTQYIKNKIQYNYLLVGFKLNTILKLNDLVDYPEYIQLLKTQLLTKNINQENMIEIIDQVLDETNNEYHHITIFLTVFRKFMKSSDLLKILIQKFEFDLINQSEYYQSKASSEKFILPTLRQERLSHFLLVWLSNDYFLDSDTHRILLDFMSRISNYNELKSIYNELLPFTFKTIEQEEEQDQLSIRIDSTRNTKKDSGYSDSFQWFDQAKKTQLKRAVSTNSYLNTTLKIKKMKRNSSPHIQKNLNQKKPLCLFWGGQVSIDPIDLNRHDVITYLESIPPFTLAQQLTLIDLYLFQKLKSQDFIHYLYHHTQPCKNPLTSLIEHFNYVSNWIASVIITQEQFEKRVFLFEYCIKVAIELSKLNNFNSLMAVLGGINSAAILRLKQTKAFIQNNQPDLYQQFLDLETLMSSVRSFSNYRSKLKEINQGIPYFGIHQQDLISLNAANKDYLMSGKIHWKKFQLIGDCISKVLRFQNQSYESIPPESFVLCLIGQKSILFTEDERYERSIEIEPRSL